MASKLKDDKEREVREERERKVLEEEQRKQAELIEAAEKEQRDWQEYMSKLPERAEDDEKPSPAMLKWANMVCVLAPGLKAQAQGDGCLWTHISASGLKNMAASLAKYHEKVDDLFKAPVEAESSSSEEDEPIPAFMPVIRAKRKLMGADAKVEMEAERLVRQVLAIRDSSSQDIVTRALELCPKNLKMRAGNLEPNIKKFGEECVAHGLMWSFVGAERPKQSHEIANPSLAEALEQRLALGGVKGWGIEFSKEEFESFQISEDLTQNCHIKVGEAYFRPAAAPPKDGLSLKV